MQRQLSTIQTAKREAQSNVFKSVLSCAAGCQILIRTGCCSLCGFTCGGPFIKIQEGYQGLVFNLGIYDRKLGPGMHILNPFLEECAIIDCRMATCKQPIQILLTMDSVTITVDSFVQYRIIIPDLAYIKIENPL